jgi:hypothetical protein
MYLPVCLPACVSLLLVLILLLMPQREHLSSVEFYYVNVRVCVCARVPILSLFLEMPFFW